LHLLERQSEAMAFNSLTLELYELEPAEYAYLRTLAGGREVAVPAGLDLPPLIDAGLLVTDQEPPHLAIQRLAESRRARRGGGSGGHFGTLRMALTERCNMACSYCFQQRMFPDEQPVMSEEVLRRTLDWFVTQGRGHPLTVQYFGGEPLLEWDKIMLAHGILRESVAQGLIPAFRETITTNGTVMSEQRARWLVDEDVDVTFSFDGPPEVNDTLRLLKSGRGSYESAARGLRRWIDAGGASSILMTATPHNVTRLPEYVRWFVEESGLAPVVVGINSPQPTAEGWETGGSLLADAIWQVWRYCADREIRFHGPGTFIPFHLRSTRPQSDACVDAAADGDDPAWPMYVSADGRRSLCLVHHRDHRVEVDEPVPAHPSGQRWHTGPDPLAECDGCIASQTCGGPCSLERILWGGRLNEDRCGFMRRMTELVLTER
jgi:uncharacterized protein